MALLSGWHGMCRARGFGSCKPRKRKKFSLKTEDESHAKQPRVDDPTPPDPGGAQSSPPPVAPPSTSFEKVAENRFGKGGCELHRAGGHSGDRTRACEMGHESAGQHAQERGSKWMQHAGADAKDRVVDEAPLEKDIGPSTARMSSLLDNGSSDGVHPWCNRRRCVSTTSRSTVSTGRMAIQRSTTFRIGSTTQGRTSPATSTPPSP